MVTPGPQLPFGSKLTYRHGANLAWLNYGVDFGGGVAGGVLANQATLNNWLGAMAGSGMNTCRWFMFTLPNPPQITVDANGVPTGISPSVWPDLDLALNMAAQHGIALDLVIFDHPETLPTAWLTDSGARQALMSALSQMFARYDNNPAILCWELFNEADNRIIPPHYVVDPVSLKATIAAFTAAVHRSTPTLATTSNGGATTLAYFLGLGLDFYSAHWYDQAAPVRTDGYNVDLNTYASYVKTYGLDKPLLIGEFYADFPPGAQGTTTDQKYADFYRNGYCGGLGWSATASAGDGMRIDWAAASRFTLR